MAWININEEIGKGHPLYGVKGWAALLVAWLIIKAVVGYLVFWSSNPLFALPVLVSIIWLGISCFLLFAHKKSFQSCLTIYLVINIGGALYSLLPDISNELSQINPLTTKVGRLGYIGVNLLLLGYIWKSVRINVTCRSRVQRNDPLLIEEESAYGVLSEELVDGERDEKLWLKATVDAEKLGRSPDVLYAEYRLGQIFSIIKTLIHKLDHKQFGILSWHYLFLLLWQ